MRAAVCSVLSLEFPGPRLSLLHGVNKKGPIPGRACNTWPIRCEPDLGIVLPITAGACSSADGPQRSPLATQLSGRITRTLAWPNRTLVFTRAPVASSVDVSLAAQMVHYLARILLGAGTI